MKPILKNFHNLIEKKEGTWLTCLNKIYEVLKHSESQVRKLLQKRQSKGEIEDMSQALKSIAGNAFSNSLIYLFLKNKEAGNIKSKIYITSKKSRVKNFDKIATIQIGNETQKPDVDIIIYTEKADQTLDIVILKNLCVFEN